MNVSHAIINLFMKVIPDFFYLTLSTNLPLVTSSVYFHIIIQGNVQHSLLPFTYQLNNISSTSFSLPLSVTLPLPPLSAATMDATRLPRQGHDDTTTRSLMKGHGSPSPLKIAGSVCVCVIEGLLHCYFPF